VIPELRTLLDEIKGKVGLVFTNEPVFDLKPKIEANRIQASAKVGGIAPISVTIPPGPTVFFYFLTTSGNGPLSNPIFPRLANVHQDPERPNRNHQGIPSLCCRKKSRKLRSCSLAKNEHQAFLIRNGRFVLL